MKEWCLFVTKRYCNFGSLLCNNLQETALFWTRELLVGVVLVLLPSLMSMVIVVVVFVVVSAALAGLLFFGWRSSFPSLKIWTIFNADPQSILGSYMFEPICLSIRSSTLISLNKMPRKKKNVVNPGSSLGGLSTHILQNYLPCLVNLKLV